MAAELDIPILRSNVRLWRTYADKPLRAVVKNDGYGWGVARLVSGIDDLVDGYCVAHSSEFFTLRALTERPIAIFEQPSPELLPDVLGNGGIPNITSAAAFHRASAVAQATGRPYTVRVGLAHALGWSGVAPSDVSSVCAQAARSGLGIEVWTHISSAETETEERRLISELIAAFHAAKADVRGVDIEASASLSRRGVAEGDHVRIGIGLFGGYARAVAGVASAVRLKVPVVERIFSTEPQVAGASRRPVPTGCWIETLRIGYGTGLPRMLSGARIRTSEGNLEIINVGMQYTIVVTDARPADRRTVIDACTDLDALAGGKGAHEIVVNLGRG